jgi:hypothetical protein
MKADTATQPKGWALWEGDRWITCECDLCKLLRAHETTPKPAGLLRRFWRLLDWRTA